MVIIRCGDTDLKRQWLVERCKKRNDYRTGRTNSQPRGVCLYTCTLLSQLLIVYQGCVCLHACTLLSQLLTVYQGCVCTRVHCWVSCKHYISWFNLRTLLWLAWMGSRLYFTTPFGVDQLSPSYRGSKWFDNKLERRICASKLICLSTIHMKRTFYLRNTVVSHPQLRCPWHGFMIVKLESYTKPDFFFEVASLTLP